MPAGDYHETALRARITTVVTAVTAVGKVYNHERHVDDWNGLIALMVADLGGGVSQLRGWTLQLGDIAQASDQLTFGGPAQAGRKHVAYHYTVRGVMAVQDDDSTPSETTFVTLALAVIKALDADTLLHSGDLQGGALGSPRFAGPPAAAGRFDYRMYGDVLVHYIEIELMFEEYV
jgi:hypothetical protein